MKRKVLFRDRQELQAADLNKSQDFTRSAFDSLTRDAITAERRFVDLPVTSVSNTEITVGLGRLYDNGKVYSKDTIEEKNLFQHLPVTSQRYVTVLAYGQTIETDVQPRDYLIDLDEGTTEPQSVAMEEWRRVNIDYAVGSESVSPVPPAVPSGAVRVADILMNTTQIVAITMIEENRLPSIGSNVQLIGALEAFRLRVQARVDTLQSTLAALHAKTMLKADIEDLISAQEEIARLRRIVGLPAGVFAFAFDDFRDDSRSDTAHVDYSASISDGVMTFPKSDTITRSLALFEPSDPNAHVTSDNRLFPKFSHSKVLDVDTGIVGAAALASYSIETTETRTVKTTKTKNVTESVPSRAIVMLPTDAHPGDWKQRSLSVPPGMSTSEARAWARKTAFPGHSGYQAISILHESKTVGTKRVPTKRTVTENVQQTVNGATLVQTFTAPRDGWLTRVGLRFQELAASGAVRVLVTMVPSGAPNSDYVISEVEVPFGDLLGGGAETVIPVPPAHVEHGERYAIWVISTAAHKVALSSEIDRLDGVLFHKDDGGLKQDQTDRCLALSLYMARFDKAQVEMRLGEVQRAGGVSEISIETEQDVPDGCEVDYEMQIGGQWYPLLDGRQLIAQQPAVVPLRVVMRGSRDVMPSIQLGADRVVTSVTGGDLVHISTPREVGTPAATVTVRLTVLVWRGSTYHGLECKLMDITNSATVEPAGTHMRVLENDLPDGADNLEFTFVFTPATATSEYQIRIEGSADQNELRFGVIERLDFAQAA